MDKKSLFYPSLSDTLAPFPHVYHHIACYALQKNEKNLRNISSQIWAKQFLEVPLNLFFVYSPLNVITYNERITTIAILHLASNKPTFLTDLSAKTLQILSKL